MAILVRDVLWPRFSVAVGLHKKRMLLARGFSPHQSILLHPLSLAASWGVKPAGKEVQGPWPGVGRGVIAFSHSINLLPGLAMACATLPAALLQYWVLTRLSSISGGGDTQGLGEEVGGKIFLIGFLTFPDICHVINENYTPVFCTCLCFYIFQLLSNTLLM